MENISLEPRRLRHFLAVAEARSFRRAALTLGMAQPPLTESIRKLEGFLGTRLFDRSERPVRLTEAGEALQSQAGAILAQSEACVRYVRRAAQGQVGALRITYVGSAAFDFLPPLVRRFRASHPDVDLDLRERPTAGQLDALRAGLADVGLVRPPVHADDMTVQRVLREPLVLAVPEEHWAARRRRVRLDELSGEDFVMFPARDGPSFYSRIVLACEQAGFAMRVAQEAVQMHVIAGLVAAGMGIALVPGSVRHLKQPGVRYRELSDASGLLFVDLAAVWPTGRESSALARFIELCAAP